MRFFDLTLTLIAPVRRALAVAIAGVVLALAGCASTGGSPAQAAQQPKNIIIMLADGASSTQWDFGRYSSKVLRQRQFATTDIVFKNGTLGLLSTHPSDAYVVDSAAAGTAMSTGFKVNNAAVAVTPDGKQVPTVMEVAKARGKRIQYKGHTRGIQGAYRGYTGGKPVAWEVIPADKLSKSHTKTRRN